MERKAVIFDFDNTLYNWMDAFAPSFIEQVNYISSETNLEVEKIIESFKKVYKEYGSVEILHAVCELDIWKLIELDRKKIESIEKNAQKYFLDSWTKHLQLFPYTLNTLELINNKKILIFGLSDAFSYWIDFRLKTLGIGKYFNKVYAVESSQLMKSSIVSESKTAANIVSVEQKIMKPETTIIEKIATDYNLKKQNIFFVGDSKEKDILTAQKSGVVDIWAQYGTSTHKKENSTILKLITPWGKKDYKIKVTPTYKIDDISEIINILIEK